MTASADDAEGADPEHGGREVDVGIEPAIAKAAVTAVAHAVCTRLADMASRTVRAPRTADEAARYPAQHEHIAFDALCMASRPANKLVQSSTCMTVAARYEIAAAQPKNKLPSCWPATR